MEGEKFRLSLETARAHHQLGERWEGKDHGIRW